MFHVSSPRFTVLKLTVGPIKLPWKLCCDMSQNPVASTMCRCKGSVTRRIMNLGSCWSHSEQSQCDHSEGICSKKSGVVVCFCT